MSNLGDIKIEKDEIRDFLIGIYKKEFMPVSHMAKSCGLNYSTMYYFMQGNDISYKNLQKIVVWLKSR